MSTPTDHEACEQESAWLRAEVESLQAQLAACREANVHLSDRLIAARVAPALAESRLAAVRTDLSVAREALRLICTEGLTVERCFELASSGLTATPPVAQLDP